MWVNIADFENTYIKVKQITDKVVGIDYLAEINVYSTSNYLIEVNTDYSNNLLRVASDFFSIREYSNRFYQNLQNTDELHRQLRKGVHILETSEQLSAYMYSYGNMHFHKLNGAIEFLPLSFFTQKVDIIDWGCGQGFASMVYLNYLNQNNIKQEINTISLIEPSQIALKRASLHINHIRPNSKIITINKDLNELFKSRIDTTTQNAKLHLFSNIIDIDTFLLSDLTKFINENYYGENYFVVVSPLIPNARKLRINEFVSYYRKGNGFKLLYEIDNYSGEWKNNWSRMIRVFKVEL